ncbi:MBL fold metallo-hydrolase [Alkalihalobacterium alkalinitrilicum]|uniref:MBL fold metallo-hydrolase n=1 Tax=Alkalihalobacterium alkalinitrilicum TaxID=427920 RepID=UPI000994ADAF|nr:MBL fold metallo-hydrolase [Alkalihalobacterium alkalinitrilicum]
MAYTKYKQKVSTITLPTPFLVGPVNVYLIEGHEALTLVDTGPKTEEGWHLLSDELKVRGYSANDIDQIVITHHHPDHVGLLDRFPNANLTGHRKVKPWIEQDVSFIKRTSEFLEKLFTEHGMNAKIIQDISIRNMSFLQFTCKAVVHQVVQSGDRIPGLNGWKVLETPGHAQSHIMLINEGEQMSISGDHLIKHISSNAIIEAPYGEQKERSKSLLQYRDSLMMLKDYKLNIAYPGHGEPIVDIPYLVDERVKEQDQRAAHIKQLIGKDTLSCDQITQRLFPKVYKKQPDLTFSETLGHLDLLEWTGQVTCENKDGFIFYKAT